MKFETGDEFVSNLVKEYCPEPTVSNTIRLQTYYKKAHSQYYLALDFVKEGNDARAYIELMRFAQLISNLPTHNNYKMAQYSEDRLMYKRRFDKVIGKMQSLKLKLIAMYNQEIENAKNAPKIVPNVNNNNNVNVTTDDDDEIKNAVEIEVEVNVDEYSSISSKSTIQVIKPPSQRWNNLKISSESQNVHPSSPITNNTNVNAPLLQLKQVPIHKKKTAFAKKSMDSLFGKSKIISPIFVPINLVSDFIAHASRNTRKDIETCAVLTGKYLHDQEAYIITHCIVPKQAGTANTVHTLHEEELIGIQEKHGVITLGWIHTHPSQTCFLSSVDMHCQLSYQIMMPNAIAIVHAPTDTTKVFSLTKKGISLLSKCSCQGFHRHEGGSGIYTEASHVHYAKHRKCTFIDISFRMFDQFLAKLESNNDEYVDELRELSVNGYLDASLNLQKLQLYGGNVELVMQDYQFSAPSVHAMNTTALQVYELLKCTDFHSKMLIIAEILYSYSITGDYFCNTVNFLHISELMQKYGGISFDKCLYDKCVQILMDKKCTDSNDDVSNVDYDCKSENTSNAFLPSLAFKDKNMNNYCAIHLSKMVSEYNKELGERMYSFSLSIEQCIDLNYDSILELTGISTHCLSSKQWNDVCIALQNKSNKYSIKAQSSALISINHKQLRQYSNLIRLQTKMDRDIMNTSLLQLKNRQLNTLAVFHDIAAISGISQSNMDRIRSCIQICDHDICKVNVKQLQLQNLQRLRKIEKRVHSISQHINIQKENSIILDVEKISAYEGTIDRLCEVSKEILSMMSNQNQTKEYQYIHKLTQSLL